MFFCVFKKNRKIFNSLKYSPIKIKFYDYKNQKIGSGSKYLQRSGIRDHSKKRGYAERPK